MTILIYTDCGNDLYESFDYLIRGIREYIDEQKWKVNCSHSRILIKSKTDSKELLITGRCVDSNKIKGLNSDFHYTTSLSAEEYLRSRGSKPLHTLGVTKTLILNFMKEE